MMKNERAMILVITLWILTLLTLLALGIGLRVGIDIKLMSFFINGLKAHYLAEAGFRKTMALLESDSNKNVDSLNEVWSCGFDFDEDVFVLKDIALGEGTFTVSYEIEKEEEKKPIYLYGASDEEGRLNINELDGDALSKLPNFSSDIVSNILDWRDEDSLERPDGAEDDYYRELENAYECKDAKFSVPEELMLVKAVTEEVYNGVKDLITVYGKDKKVNINTASRKVLAVLIDPRFEGLPDKIIRYRNGADEIPGTKDDRIFTDTLTIVTRLSDPLSGGLDSDEREHLNYLIKEKGYFKVSSQVFRIISRGEVKGGRIKKRIECVAERSDRGSEFLYYHEN